MKNKPVKHKESNTFRFLPFAERIAAIDVDVFHQVDRRRGVEDEGENQTFLYLALEKWNVLNCTDSYADFRHRFISPEDVETLPQLVLHSDDVAKKLLKSLARFDYHSLQPILECVVALAKDLRHDFYQYFPAYVIRIVNILTAPIPPEGRGQREADITEWCLACLAHLCKILWRPMLKDWSYVYGSLLLPLILVNRTSKSKSREDGKESLGSTNVKQAFSDTVYESENANTSFGGPEEKPPKLNERPSEDTAKRNSVTAFQEKLLLRPLPEYVQEFVVQSFAFVARKAKDKSAFLVSVLSALKEKSSGISGTGQLLAEVVKGIQGQFHSCADQMVPILLQLACRHSDDSFDLYDGIIEEISNEEEKSMKYQLVKHTLLNVLSIIKPDKGAWLLWKSLIDAVLKCASVYKKNMLEEHRVSFHRSLLLLNMAVDFHNGSWLLSDMKQGILPTVQPKSILTLPKQLGNLIAFILQIPELNDGIALQVSGLVGSILCSPAVAQGRLRLEQEVAAKLASQMLLCHHAAAVIKFVEKTVNFAGFETLILPHLMAFCYNYQQNITDTVGVRSGKNILDLLACLILKKAPPCLSGGASLKDWQPYKLDLKRMSVTKEQRGISPFESTIKESLLVPTKRNFSEMDVYISALIILPHLNCVDDMGEMLITSVNSLFDILDGKEDSDELSVENLLFVLSEAIITTVLMKDDVGRISRNLSLRRVIDCLLPHAAVANRLPALRALDVYLTATLADNALDRESEQSPSIMHEIFNTLSVNLASPYREVCRLTLHLLAELEKKEICKENVESIFSSCLAAENVPLTIHDFREKIGLLEALKVVLHNANEGFDFKNATLKYLLGLHFANFRLLWEPVSKVIVSFALANPKSFWEVFIVQLKLAMAFVRVDGGCTIGTHEMISAAQMAKKWEHCNLGSFLSNCEYLSEWYSKRFTLPESPDFVNYRVQLLTALCEITEICEARNRDISEIFLSFYREEFMKSDSKVAPTWDIRKAGNDAGVDDVDEEVDEEVTDSLAGKSHFSVRLSTKSMIAFLKLLAKMRNPKAMYKEPELAQIYEEMISHRNPEIQRHSLDCLLVYRYKNLFAYRENLYSLIDEKKFKSELNLFRIDKESELVKEEHRSQLMPLVMQILFSKMQSGNKRTGHQRRSLVLRFIAGCHDKEIVIFLKMAFGLLTSLVEDSSEDAANMVRRVMSSIELEKAVHPKRLLSISNLLVVVVERLGNLLLPLCPKSTTPVSSEALDFLLRCLLCTNALVAGEYAKKELIHPCHLTSLRAARASGLGAMSTFFRRLDHYPWSVTSTCDGVVLGDLEAMFEATIWPWLDQLPIEGIHSPTALLKLILVWSENPRYYPLLAKKRLSSAGEYDSIIPAVMGLLDGRKTRPSVVNAILDMVEKLLTYASESETGIPMEVSEEHDVLPELPPLEAGSMIDLPKENTNKLHISHQLNFGSKLILPHVPVILKVLTQRFRALKKGGSPSPRDLRVLSQLSELVWEQGDSEALIELILPVAVRKASLGATGEQMCQLLLTAKNLLHNVSNPRKFLKAIAPLFSTVDGRPGRSILCQILNTVASHSKQLTDISDEDSNEDDVERIFSQEDLTVTAKILNSLNSWDPSRLEEPDYTRRLETYRELKTMREGEEKFPLVLGIMLIHNSFYAIRNEKDLSLRESAGHCLLTLAPILAISSSTNGACRNLVIGETILGLIAKALKDRKAPESLHYDAIGTLGALVHQCPTLHPMLKDLSRLACKVDQEVDFFENIRHLQLHRRGRALMRFVEDAKVAQRPMGPQTLTSIILPLAFKFLFNPHYAKNNSLVDSAIEAVGAACHCLPWFHYEAILKHQLIKLHREATEFGKQPIRLIVAILNNYHFDLSRADKEEPEERMVVTEHEPCPEKQAEVKEDASALLPVEDDVEIPDDESATLVEEKEEEITEEVEEEVIIGTETVEQDVLDAEEVSPGADESSHCPADVPAWSQDLLLPASSARRARKALSTVLLPRLHTSLVAPTERDSSHKLNRRAQGAVGADTGREEKKSKSGGPKDEEETLVMRVPIALAAIKMLQRLPSDFMTNHLTGVLLKILAFLKCRLESVRRVARDTLVEVGVSLGPAYLPTIVREMSSLLLPTRGYAFHVLAFTSHSLLVSLVPLMKLGDMDKCLRDFIEICKADLFGVTSEEKEVTRITAKVYEARSHKSYDSFQLLAKVISESCIIDLVQPLKEVLDQTHSFKCVKITKECLSRVVRGLVENKFLSPSSLLAFTFGLLSKSITSLWPPLPTQLPKVLPRRAGGAYAGINGKASMPLELPEDPYLIPKEPRKVRSKVTGAINRVGAQANAHAMTEFGLQLLNSLLKKEQIRWKRGVGMEVVLKHSNELNPEVREESNVMQYTVDVVMLDPLVPVVCECLESKHVKLTSLALNCFRLMIGMELPTMENHISKAATAVYSILHKYAGATSGENYNLAVAAFKVVAVLVRQVRTLPVEEDHLSALLTYVSRDLDLGGEVGVRSGGYGPARTATAFGVLRAVLARRLRSPIIPSLMKRVATLSISAQAVHIQSQSRQVFLQFLMDYPMNKKKLEQHISFYLGQLNYELLSGRESALEFLHSMVSTFPEEEVKNHSGILFVALGARLVEEEVPNCKRRVAAVIKSLLIRLSHQSRDKLFDFLIIWMKDSENIHQQIAVQLCGIFVLAEGGAFASRLTTVFPVIVEILKSDRSQKTELNGIVPTGLAETNPKMFNVGSGKFARVSRISGDLQVNGSCDVEDVGDYEPGKYVRAPRDDEDCTEPHSSVDEPMNGEDDNSEGCGSGGRYVRAPKDDEEGVSDNSVDGEEAAESSESGFEEDEENTGEAGIIIEESKGGEYSMETCDDMDAKRDPLTFHVLQLILKIFMTCPETLSKQQWREYTNDIAVHAQCILAHPHEWIRFSSCQVLGSIFASVNAADIASRAIQESSNEKATKAKKRNSQEPEKAGLPFLFLGIKQRIKSLILDLCAQLDTRSIGMQLAEQVVKNLVFLARVLMNIDKLDGKSNKAEPATSSDDQEIKLNLSWMMRKMRNIVNAELTQAPKQTSSRSAVFKWLAAVALDLSNEPDCLRSHLHYILRPIVREMENKPGQGGEPRSKEVKELRRLAYEVNELIKEKVGLETYAEVVRDIQRQFAEKRTERKRIRAQEVVHMPEKAAKRKIKKQLVKKQFKKRKISIIKGRKLK